MNQEFGTLKRKVVSSVFFSAGAQVGRHAVQLAAVAVLARLLGPDPLGAMALAVIALALVQLLVDMGLGASVTREQELTRTQEKTVLLLNAAAALGAFGLVLVAAPAVASAFGAPALSWLLPVVAPGYLLVSALQSRRALLNRALRFRAVAVIELSSVALGSGTSIFLAHRGWGLRALAAGALVQQGVWAALVVVFARLPRGGSFCFGSVRGLIRFGAPMTGFNLVNFFARGLDKLMIGAAMGTFALGLYEKAYALMMLPVTYLAGSIGQVMYPSLSKVRGDSARMSFLYLGAVRKMAGLAFPTAAFCVVAADDLVLLLLGDRFAEAIPIFRVLATTMALQPIVSSFGWLYMVQGRPGLMLAWSAVGTTILVGAFAVGTARGTPEAVAHAYAVAFFGLFPVLTMAACRVGGISAGAFLRRLAAPAVSAGAALVVGLACPGLPLPLAFLLVAGVYSITYSAVDFRAFFDLVRFLNPARAFQV